MLQRKGTRPSPCLRKSNILSHAVILFIATITSRTGAISSMKSWNTKDMRILAGEFDRFREATQKCKWEQLPKRPIQKEFGVRYSYYHSTEEFLAGEIKGKTKLKFHNNPGTIRTESIEIQSCTVPAIPSKEDGPFEQTWMVSRIGPFNSFGGNDWHSFQPDNGLVDYEGNTEDKNGSTTMVPDFGDFLGQHHLPLSITAFQYGPVSEQGEVLDMPPLRVHHAHLSQSRGIGEVAHAYDDQICRASHGGKNCTLATFPVGFGIHLENPLNLPDFKINDVRAEGSRKLTWYMQYASRYQREPPSLASLGMLAFRNPVHKLSKCAGCRFHNVWEFDERRSSEALYYYTVRPPFFGHILNSFMIHVHHDWIDELRVYCATPHELGLTGIDPDGFMHRSVSHPLYLRKRGKNATSTNNRENLTAAAVIPRIEEKLTDAKQRSWEIEENKSTCTRDLLWSLAPRSERSEAGVWRKTIPTYHGSPQNSVAFGPSSVFTVVSLASSPQLRATVARPSQSPSQETSESGILAPQHSLIYFWYTITKGDFEANEQLRQKLKVLHEPDHFLPYIPNTAPRSFILWSNGVDHVKMSSFVDRPEHCDWTETNYWSKRQFIKKHQFCNASTALEVSTFKKFKAHGKNGVHINRVSDRGADDDLDRMKLIDEIEALKSDIKNLRDNIEDMNEGSSHSHSDKSDTSQPMTGNLLGASK